MKENTKISLTIELEGSVTVRSNEKPVEVKYKITKRDLEPLKQFKGKDGLKIVRRGTYLQYPIITKPASQHINMTEDAYNYFISNECPEWSKPSVWRSMNAKQRLEAHLKKTCEHFNGKSYSYVILDD